MRKSILLAVLCMGMFSLLLTGCHKDTSTNFNNMSRADQEKMMKGDPAKIQEISKEMAAQQMGRPKTPAAPARPPQ